MTDGVSILPYGDSEPFYILFYLTPFIAVETQGKTTRDRGALGKEDEVKHLAVTSGLGREHEAFDCHLCHAGTLFFFHVCPVLNTVRSCFVSVAARFIGQKGQGRGGEGGPGFQWSVPRAEGT